MTAKKNLDEFVFEKLKRGLINGEMFPGRKIDVDEIALRYEVSRTPVVQALKRMYHDGMVQLSSAGKYSVPEFSAEEVRDICHVRHALEKEAVDMIAADSENIDWTNLELLTSRSYKTAEEGDVVESRNVDIMWHEELVHLSANKCLQHIYRQVHGQYMMADYGKKRYAPDMQIASAKEHVVLFVNLKKGNFEEVKRILESHIMNLPDSEDQQHSNQ